MMDVQAIYEHRDDFAEYLKQFISPRKLEIIENHLKDRTRFLTVVLEDIHKSHNASAVMRTCECFGLQDIHIIEIEHKYEVHPHIASGSGRWTNRHHYNDPEKDNTSGCIHRLKQNGYKVLVTSLAPNAKPFDEVKIDTPTAVVFGTEYYGVSDQAVALADECIHIPMVGFTDSLNISVSCGIILQEYRRQMIKNKTSWHLSPKEVEITRLQWYMNSVRNIDYYIQNFLSINPS